MKASGLLSAIAIATLCAACASGREAAQPSPGLEHINLPDHERYGGPPQRDWENFDRAGTDDYMRFRA